MTATDTRSPEPAPTPPSAPAEDEAGYGGLIFLIALLVVLGFTTGMSMVLVVVGLIFMIFMHELGHYLAARRAGMKVTEFFIGFGPRLWSFHRGETEYGVKGIPAGAYVKVIGMSNLEEVDPAEEHRTYRQGRYRDRLLLAAAGSLMHFLMALVLLWAIFVFYGERDEALADTQWSVEQVLEDGPAAAMGFAEGDTIVGADGAELATWTDARLFIEARPGETVTFDVVRGGETVQLTGEIGVNDQTGNGRIGVARSAAPRVTEGPIEAIGSSVTEFGTASKDAVVGLGRFFSPSGLGDFFSTVFGLGGDDEVVAADQATDDEGRIISVVGAARIGADLTDEGWAGFALFFIQINIFVGIFNLFPMLPLDGGHVAVATYERIRSRKGRRYHADVAKLLPLAYAVVFILVTVGLAAIWLDLTDPVSL